MTRWRARERDQLPLSGRQRAAAFADPLEVAAWQRRDEVVRADLARGGFHLGVGRVLAAVGDVVADRAREQEGLLRHDTQLLVETDLVVLVHGHVVDRDGARRRVVEAGDELHDRALARAGLADERDGLARDDLHVDAAERVVDGARVAEAHVVELDVALDAPGHDRLRGRRHGRRRVEQLGDPLDRDPRLLVGVEHLRQLLDRREEQGEVEQERDERADRQRAVRDEHAARAEHDAGRDVGEEVDEREVDGDESLRVHTRVAIAGRDLAEHLLVLVFAHERLRDPDARQALLQVGVDRGDAIARDAVRAGRRRPEPRRSR